MSEPYSRQEMVDKHDQIKIGSIFLTRYERSRIIGARALQISFGAPILTTLPSHLDPMKIAEKELREKMLPLTIRREYPELDGAKEFQDIPVQWLLLEE
ncbi:MAG TPA: DNA-directed RNA polymerase subunit K [Candidatus Lokiarchaeia archaeon]|nr:DNA-directed RNA polymerase subunit K [Candidatus Lokiarchaeia archaeon]